MRTFEAKPAAAADAENPGNDAPTRPTTGPTARPPPDRVRAASRPPPAAGRRSACVHAGRACYDRPFHPPDMTSRATLLLAFTLLGLAAASAATWVHADLVRHPDLSSVCDISATVNCTEAYSSAYGKLGGVPVAVLGVLFFGGLLLLQSCSRGVARARAGARRGLCLRSVSARRGVRRLPGDRLLVRARRGLSPLRHDRRRDARRVCGRCPHDSIPVRFASQPSRPRSPRPAGPPRRLRAVLGAVFVAAAVALLALFPRAAAEPVFASDGEAPEFVAPPPAEEALPQASQVGDYMNTATRRMIPVDAAGAVVIVVKFNDYQCPPCGNTFQAFKPLKAKWDKEAPGKVKFVTKDFPLEGECNASIPQGPHPIACEAAAAVRMARKNGKAEPLEDWLFANQATLTPGRAEAGRPRHRRRRRLRCPVSEDPDRT